MAVYAIAIIPMILMIVDITSKIDNSTKTAAYADHVTDAGKFIQLKISIEIMVNCKRKN